MKIAVNTRLLLKDRLEGIGWFAFETLRRITTSHPEHEFIFLFDRKFSKEFVFNCNVNPVVVPPQARHPFLYYLWFEHAVPSVLQKYKTDIFLSPDGYLSLSTSVPSIPVIHDLNFEHRPDDLPFLTRRYYRHYFSRFARKATRIATVSQFSKNDIVSCYHIVPEKIDIVYNGVGKHFKPLDETEQHDVREKISQGRPYFLFVGSLHPRKNIVNLFRAFDVFRSSVSSDFRLVIVGQKKWWTHEMQSVYSQMKHRGDVIFTGRLNDEALARVTAAAYASVYVSLFEGFGVPVIEAMRCGVPVITSERTSMPEIAGGAALLTDPCNYEAIARAMLRLVQDKAFRETLIDKGLQRQAYFSWDKTAEKLWDCIEKAVAER